MPIPFVNQFINPYELWKTRPASVAEQIARTANGCPFHLVGEPTKVSLIDTINSPYKAGLLLLTDNHSTQIENSVTASLNSSHSGYNLARSLMPRKTPQILSNYQRLYSPSTDMIAVNNEIVTHGDFLHDGQSLFHGGGILNALSTPGQSIQLVKPLATSFCPVKAYNNGNWKGKYFNEGQVDLIILTVNKITVRSFVFKINGTDKGHEKEVLIASGATLTLNNRQPINTTSVVGLDPTRPSSFIKKTVPVYLVHATIS